jgi:uncharacterized RDD family membrane protein YckC
MQNYQTFWRRVAAMAIDAVVLTPVMGLSLFLMWRGMSFTTYCLMRILGTIAGCLYWIGMHGRYGQTLGKMVAGVKVLKMDDQPICYGVAAVRYLPFLVVGLTAAIAMTSFVSGRGLITFNSMQHTPRWPNFVKWVWTLAEVITLASNPMRRAIHDFIAGTKVVVVQKHVPPPVV